MCNVFVSVSGRIYAQGQQHDPVLLRKLDRDDAVVQRRWKKLNNQFLIWQYLLDFSLLPLPRVYRARQDPAHWQHGAVRVPALRQEDPELSADHVPVWPGLLHDRARALGGHLHRRGVVTSPAAQALSDVSDTSWVTVTILQMCWGLSPECQTAEVSSRGRQGDIQEKERRRWREWRGLEGTHWQEEVETDQCCYVQKCFRIWK